MKISFSWLKQYIHFSHSPEEIAQFLTNTGLEVESLEKRESVKGGLEGCVVGHVVECTRHPNADRLRLTKVDIGEKDLLSIVCGADNVAQGQKVIVATIGTTLYPANGEPVIIKEANIRGELSRGMICAEDELGLGKSHDGIIVLPDNITTGTRASAYFELESDYLLEIGLTPNRADAASHYGVARDLHAVTGAKLILPDVRDFMAGKEHLVDVIVENTNACERYSGLVIEGVQVKESPQWLRNRLTSVGLSPVNNIVDITNYVVNEIGQPLHAFDYAKISGKKIIIKTGLKGKEFTTLDGISRKLEENDLMICNETEPMCIAGVYGGEVSGISETTKTIFLESACFNPDNIRKTAQKHGLKTDASFRFERGTDPQITLYALKRAALLIMEIAGGKAISPIIDKINKPIQKHQIIIRYKNIDRLIGIQIDRKKILNILERLEFEILDESSLDFTVKVPTYRVEVKHEADIIEEIIRIYGLDNIPLDDHLKANYISAFPSIDKDLLEEEVGKLLVANGFLEIFNNSLTKSSYRDLPGEDSNTEALPILNKLSEDQGIMRQTLIYQALESAVYNINRKNKNLKFFEFGKTYSNEKKGISENKKLTLLITGSPEEESWQSDNKKVSFYTLNNFVSILLHRLQLGNFALTELAHPAFEYAFSITSGKKEIGIMGKISAKFSRIFDLRQEVFISELDWESCINHYNNKLIYNEIPKFPSVRRDLSLVIDKSVRFADIEHCALASGIKTLNSINVFDVYEGGKLEAGKKSYSVSFLLQDIEKTLTDSAIDQSMETLIKQFENKLGAIIRR